MFSKNQLGFFYMFISICAFSVMDVIVKWTNDYPVGQVLFFRGFCGLIPILFIIPKERYIDFYKTSRPLLHFKRCMAGIIALISIVIALRNLPLATVVSVTFAAPIFTTIFSIFLLNEKVGFYRWLAVIVGFIGIIVISEPGFSSLNFYFILPIIFCLGLSYVAITIRRLSTTEPVWLIGFFFSISIMILSFFTFYQNWLLPNLVDLFLLSMIGILGGLANLWLTQSYKLSEVSLVTPVKYLALVFAIIFGYLIWDEIPTTKTLLGAILVIASSIIIFRREIVLKKNLSLSRHE
ncbi:DMT family transporter [Candidatus Pelagibacter bacterium nBUS_29]|uniref:DMT family transporter n=1 Tax=Candidatus Pelagibacter bacterium nBUS_29 TaxID=3374190 RepID=UPI003EBA612B